MTLKLLSVEVSREEVWFPPCVVVSTNRAIIFFPSGPSGFHPWRDLEPSCMNARNANIPRCLIKDKANRR